MSQAGRGIQEERIGKFHREVQEAKCNIKFCREVEGAV